MRVEKQIIKAHISNLENNINILLQTIDTVKQTIDGGEMTHLSDTILRCIERQNSILKRIDRVLESTDSQISNHPHYGK